MRDNSHFAMISPAPGFAARAMARIVEYERTRARQRALIGSALLVGSVIALLAFAVIQFVPTLWVLVTNPSVIVTGLNAFEVLAFWVIKLLGAFWIAASVIAANLDLIQMTLGAGLIFALTMLWARVVTGSFQLSPSTNHVGGFRK